MQLCKVALSTSSRLKKVEVVFVAREESNALIRSMREHRENWEMTFESSAASAVTVVEPLLLTIPQAARVLAVGRTTLYELIAAGALETVHIGRSVRVPVAAIRSFVDQQRVSQ